MPGERDEKVQTREERMIVVEERRWNEVKTEKRRINQIFLY